MSIEAAKRMFAEAGVHLHGHHSHGHAPYPSHDPPRLQHGGWYPPGAGPFRPGPGAPTMGARMPAASRPGVAFGGVSLVGAGVPMLIGSTQRFTGYHPTIVGAAPKKPQKLTPTDIAQLRAMILAALGGTTRSGRPASANSLAALAAIAARAKAPSQSRVFAPVSHTQAASLVMSARRKAQENAQAAVENAMLSLNPWSPQAAAVQSATQAAAQDAASYWGSTYPSPGPASPTSSDASLSLDVNLPTPSASASLSF